jgi:hypothetical protein
MVNIMRNHIDGKKSIFCSTLSNSVYFKLHNYWCKVSLILRTQKPTKTPIPILRLNKMKHFRQAINFGSHLFITFALYLNGLRYIVELSALYA